VKTYTCDRCKNVFGTSGPLDAPPAPTESAVRLGSTVKIPIVVQGDRTRFVEVDLCGQCVRSLSDWMSDLLDRRSILAERDRILTIVDAERMNYSAQARETAIVFANAVRAKVEADGRV